MDISVQKCGEVTASFTEGKREYFLNCMFCDRMFLTLDKFGKHVEYVHLDLSDGYDLELLGDYKISEETNASMDDDEVEVVDVKYIQYMQYILLYYTEKCFYQYRSSG